MWIWKLPAFMKLQRCLKEDIFYLEVDSLDNELLKYANEKIER